MAFALILAGAAMLVIAVQGNVTGLTNLIKKEFSGPDNFTYWLVTILVIGAIGYIEKAKPVADMLLVLVVLSLLMVRGKAGLFKQAGAAISLTNTPVQPTPTASNASASNTVAPATTSAMTALQNENFSLGTSPSIYNPIQGLIQ